MSNERLAKNAKVVFIFLLLAGIFFVDYMIIPDVVTAISSTNWPTADGWVVISRVAESYDPHYWQVWYYPEVTYRYTVAGIEYVSKEALPPVNPWEVVKQYSPGSHVIVFFNPSSPSQGVLETGFDAIGGDICFLSMTIVIVPALVIWLIRVINKRPAEQGL